MKPAAPASRPAGVRPRSGSPAQPRSGFRSLITAPNLITFCRLLLFVPMWVLALNGHGRVLGVLVAFCLFTDFLDGFVARRTGTATHFGAVLDSLADNLLLVSAPIWLYRLSPALVDDHPVWAAVFVGALVAVFAVMAIKFRRNVELHTYAAKGGIIVFWLFVVYTLETGYSRSLFDQSFFYLTMVTSYYYLAEDLYLLLTRSELDEHVHWFLSP